MSREWKTTSAQWTPGSGNPPDPTPPDKSGKWRLVGRDSAKNAPETEQIKRASRDDRYPSYINAWKEEWVTVPHWNKSVTLMWFWEKDE